MGIMEIHYADEWEYLEEQATPVGLNGGCLPGMMIPPIAVLAVSTILVIGIFKLPLLVTGPIQVPATNHTGDVNTSSAENVNSPASPEPISIEASRLAPLFTAEVQHWEAQIVAWAENWNLDPNLVATVMQIESCGDPQARSSAGAMGLFQVMPFHFAAGENGFDPKTNAQRGMSYLRNALDARGGEARLAFAGYNGGINGAKRPESQWAAETIRYVYWGSGIYHDATQGKEHSDLLADWLGKGGARLCAQANQRLGLDQ
jgi:hypothetical protein